MYIYICIYILIYIYTYIHISSNETLTFVENSCLAIKPRRTMQGAYIQTITTDYYYKLLLQTITITTDYYYYYRLLLQTITTDLAIKPRRTMQGAYILCASFVIACIQEV